MISNPSAVLIASVAASQVLLVDLDPQANCTSGLGIEPPEGEMIAELSDKHADHLLLIGLL